MVLKELKEMITVAALTLSILYIVLSVTWAIARGSMIYSPMEKLALGNKDTYLYTYSKAIVFVLWIIGLALSIMGIASFVLFH